jgi:hypothetical protein
MTMQPPDDDPRRPGSGDPDEPHLAGLPAFETGGRVERTGIALVHEGEYIVPAPGSEAIISQSTAGDDMTINYYFPVVVEVIGGLGEAQMQQIADYVFDELNAAWRSRA